MSDRFYDSSEDVITTSHNDKITLQQLKQEVIKLQTELKQKNQIIKDYEETISKYSIEDIKEAVNDLDLSNEDVGNIMNNQAFIVVKDVRE